MQANAAFPLLDLFVSTADPQVLERLLAVEIAGSFRRLHATAARLEAANATGDAKAFGRALRERSQAGIELARLVRLFDRGRRRKAEAAAPEPEAPPAEATPSVLPAGGADTGTLATSAQDDGALAPRITALKTTKVARSRAELDLADAILAVTYPDVAPAYTGPIEAAALTAALLASPLTRHELDQIGSRDFLGSFAQGG